MIVEILSRAWAVRSPLPKTVDLIVPVAHGATETEVTRGSSWAIYRTVMLSRKYPEAKIFFGAFSGSPNPEVEEKYKRKKLPTGVYVGKVVSTVEECLKIKAALPVGFDPKTVLIVTDEAHSRRCRMVWRTFFPESDVRIFSFAIEETTDPESPMRAYRNTWMTLLFQAAPTPLFWWWCRKGPEYLATKARRYHQPIVR